MLDKIFTPFGFFVVAFFFIGVVAVILILLKILSDKGGEIDLSLKDKRGSIKIGAGENKGDKLLSTKEVKKGFLDYRISVLLLKFCNLYSTYTRSDYNRITEHLRVILGVNNKLESMVMSSFEHILKTYYDNALDTDLYKSISTIVDSSIKEIILNLVRLALTNNFSKESAYSWDAFKRDYYNVIIKDSFEYFEKGVVFLDTDLLNKLSSCFDNEISRNLYLQISSILDNLREIENQYNIIQDKILLDMKELSDLNGLDDISSILVVK